ncbi:hypothetical protein [Serratia fonticola]
MNSNTEQHQGSPARLARAFLRLSYSALCASLSHSPSELHRQWKEIDRCHSAPPAWQNRHERNIFATETALHRTRLHVLDQEIFSVLNSYKPPSQAALCLGLFEQSQTEKIETDFSVFQFSDRVSLSDKCLTD